MSNPYAGKFIVFAGEKHYPGGGWKDYAAAFDTDAEAIAYARGRTDFTTLTWAHVYEVGRGIIFEAPLAPRPKPTTP